MTVPRFLMALIIIYILAFKLNVQEIGSFFSAQYGGAPWSLGQVRRPGQACLAGGRDRHLRRPRLQYARHARQSARHAERPICRDGARQGPVRTAPSILRHAVPNALHPLVAYQGVVLPYMLTGEIEVAIVFGLPTVGPAIVGSHGGRRRLGHRHLHAGAGGDADRRQHHLRHAAGLLDPRIRLGGTHERPIDPRFRCRPMPTAPCRRRRRASPTDAVRGRFAHGNESYLALVWRRFRRSVIGMIGLVLVVAAAGDGDLRRFLRADGPEGDRHRLRAAGLDQLPRRRTAVSACCRASIRSSRPSELDPVTFQPLDRPGLRPTRRCSASSSRATTTSCSG